MFSHNTMIYIVFYIGQGGGFPLRYKGTIYAEHNGTIPEEKLHTLLGLRNRDTCTKGTCEER